MNRKVVLLSVVILTVISAGCMGMLSGDTDPIEQTPQESDVLMHVDMGLFEDDDIEQLSKTIGEEDPAFDGIDEELEEFEDETGLDATEADELLVFADTEPQTGDGEESFGVVVHSDWDEEELIESIEDEGDITYEATTYAGEDVLYEPTEQPEFGTAFSVGVLDDGQFVIGTESAVTASLDTVYDDAEPVDGELREMYEEMHGGHVTVAVDVSDEFADATGITEDATQATVAGGAFDTGDGQVVLESQLVTGDENTAVDLTDMIKGGLAEVRQDASDEDVEDELRSIEVEQDGTTVTISYDGDIDDLEELMESDI